MSKAVKTNINFHHKNEEFMEAKNKENGNIKDILLVTAVAWGVIEDNCKQVTQLSNKKEAIKK